MKSSRYRKPFSLKLAELEDDIARLSGKWDLLLGDENLCNNPLFLEGSALDILKLDRHAKEMAEIGGWPVGARLIHHLLTTPWGAPFVSEETLLSAAITYPDEIPLESRLHSHLSQIALYSQKCKIPVIQELKLLLEEIHNFKATAA